MMKSTREKILNTLLTKPRSSIRELAEIIGINGISVRHHLINLQAEGIIEAEEQRHGVGRPRFIYRLTELGMEKFPANYLKLTHRLIEKLEQTYSEKEVRAIFVRIGEDLANEYRLDDLSISLEERIDLISGKLAEEGYRLSWRKEGDKIKLFNQNCPYHYLSGVHPTVCMMDNVLFGKVFGVPFKQVECMSSGAERCSFISGV